MGRCQIAKPCVGVRLSIYYGGTFDPVHLGHLAIARAARDQLQVAVRLVIAPRALQLELGFVSREPRCCLAPLELG